MSRVYLPSTVPRLPIPHIPRHRKEREAGGTEGRDKMKGAEWSLMQFHTELLKESGVAKLPTSQLLTRKTADRKPHTGP
jgi:hypothetical protein